MTDILNVISPVFLVIGIGFFLRRRGIITADVNSVLSRLVFYLAGPCLLFRSAALSSISEVLDLRTLAVVMVATAVTAFGAFFVCAGSSPSRRGVIAQGVYRSNMVFVGLPVIVNAYGDVVLGPAAVYIGLMVPVYNLLAVMVLLLPHQNKDGSWAIYIKTGNDIFTNPLILGSIAGILYSVTGFDLPFVADRTLEALGAIAMPLALLSVGADLGFDKLRADLKTAGLVAFVKLIVYPALVYWGLRVVGLTGVFLQFPVLIVASPTAVVSAVMAREMRGDENLAGAIVIGTTVGSLFTLSLWLAFFNF